MTPLEVPDSLAPPVCHFSVYPGPPHAPTSQLSGHGRARWCGRTSNHRELNDCPPLHVYKHAHIQLVLLMHPGQVPREQPLKTTTTKISPLLGKWHLDVLPLFSQHSKNDSVPWIGPLAVENYPGRERQVAPTCSAALPPTGHPIYHGRGFSQLEIILGGAAEQHLGAELLFRSRGPIRGVVNHVPTLSQVGKMEYNHSLPLGSEGDSTLRHHVQRNICLHLKDAHFHIPIYPPHRKNLPFAFQGICCKYYILPFSLPFSPRVFVRCMEVAIATLRW